MSQTATRPSGAGTPRTRSRQRPLRRWGPWAALLVVLVVALTLGRTHHQSFEQKVMSVARTIRCPQCVNESAAASNATAAQGVRTEIAKRLRQGQSPDQIRSYFSTKYGPGILLTPSSSGLQSLVWILPVVGVLLALAALTVAFRRWRRSPRARLSDADRAIVAAERAARRAAVGDNPEQGDGR